MFRYTVQPGDYLGRIANMFGVSIEAILLANAGISPYAMIPGQIILIPINAILYQRYPWYIFFPNLFISYPQIYWNDQSRWPDRSRWPDHWRGPGPRPGSGFSPGPRPGAGFSPGPRPGGGFSPGPRPGAGFSPGPRPGAGGGPVRRRRSRA